LDLNEPDSPSVGKWKLTPTVNVSLPSTGLPFLDTETSAPWIGAPSNPSMSSAEDSPAKTSALPGSEPGSTEPGPACGVNTSEPFATFDPATCSWRTSQASLLTNTLDVYSETWPRAGTMRNGQCYQQPNSELRTCETEFGLWPTPSAQQAGESEAFLGRLQTKDGAPWRLGERAYDPLTGKHTQKTLNRAVKMWPTPTEDDSSNVNPKPNRRPGLVSRVNEAERIYWPTPSVTTTGGPTGLGGGSGNKEKLEQVGLQKMATGQLNPRWVEWLMGYPPGWTALEDSAMPSSRKSRKR